MSSVVEKSHHGIVLRFHNAVVSHGNVVRHRNDFCEALRGSLIDTKGKFRVQKVQIYKYDF